MNNKHFKKLITQGHYADYEHKHYDRKETMLNIHLHYTQDVCTITVSGSIDASTIRKTRGLF